MMLSETNGALVIEIPQLYCLFTVCKSDRATLFSNLSDMRKTWGDMIQVPGDITLGEMTSGRLL